MLKEKLGEDLKSAMRAGDRSRVSIIRLVRAGIKYAEVAKGATLDESGVISVIMKEIREHRDSLAEFKKANRTDLTKKNEEELEILLEYLPQQMSREEIAAAAQEVIAQIGARGTADKGKVMPVLMAQLRGKADGRDVNEVVSELLAK
ncbi:MAG TPA: GatB/YqeY domain-containing protein, partial [Dehalococcoidia bacterium]|nr:GatB/YqeY domain-containing protein [Dehalococcoidia bacterium]